MRLRRVGLAPPSLETADRGSVGQAPPYTRLIMTREAIMRGIVLPVALDAEAHGELRRQDDPVHRFDVAVALAAIDARGNVHAVVEVGEVREIRDAHPPNRLPLLVVLTNLLDLGVMNDDPAVAQHARLDRR